MHHLSLAVIILLAAACAGPAAPTPPAPTGAEPGATARADVGFVEVTRDGRIYVLASEASAKKFEETGHLTFTRTRIGDGPRGETVVIEADAKDDAVADRLQAAFAAKHGLKW